MEFRTPVVLPKAPFFIEPLEPMLFVGSCFADSMGRRFQEERFPVTVNPYGVMYNPASILHTVEQYVSTPTSHPSPLTPHAVFLTLGTSHVYRLKETGQIVDNCQKRPQNLFSEEQLTIAECTDYLDRAVDILVQHNPNVHVVVTVSPIRYAKYGFHGSQLSKATLLLAAERLVAQRPCVTYFPAYEIVLDELRDYRFYQPDMLHPSQQAVEYIWQQLVEAFFSPRAKQFLAEWQPIKQALAHRPFNPDSEEYQYFLEQTRQKEAGLLARYIIYNKV
jgi:hypothetical protein